MTVKRIVRVYYDLDNYVKPKEVSKVFNMMDKRDRLIMDKRAARGKNNIARLDDQLTLINADLEMICKVISPKDCVWGVNRHNASGKDFWVLTITEIVTDSMHKGGQDE
jgi:hypothetical protein